MAGILSGLRGVGRSRAAEGYNPLGGMNVPLRQAPDQPDDSDKDRIDRFLREYNRQTDTLLIADRQIEYNVRMLCNQQWNFWNWETGQYIDVSEWFTAEEARYRQLPTVNDELRWFTNTHARLTENPPTLTFVPGPDRTDAMLAEVLDTLVKLDWRRANMEAIYPEIMMWVVAAGRGHSMTRIDTTKGDWRPWVGRARLPLVDGQMQPIPDPNNPGQPLMSADDIPDVPIKYDGTPNAVLTERGPVKLGEGHMERTGGIAVDVLSPLQVRGEWGPQLWHKKRWHAAQRFMTPEQVFETWGVEVEPDVNSDGAANVAILERVLYGAGFYGTTRGVTGASGYPGADVKGPLCTVIERWDAPLPFDERLVGTWAEPMMETPENPGGRHIVFTPKTVISDGAREVAWPYVSPIRCWDFLRVPGRPRGLTPLEILHGPQRSINKLTQLIQDSVSLNGAPQRVVWEGFGIQADQIDNAPNRVYTAEGGDPSMGAPIAFLAPPPMNPDVWRSYQLFQDNLQRLGGFTGQQGKAPTPDASGELVKELRFNEDRDLGDPARRAAGECGRIAEDWRAAYKLIYTFEQVIVAAGLDNVARTITVFPDLWTGTVNVQADAESALPEGRGERQSRAYRLWKDGAFNGDGTVEGMVEGTEIFLELSRFPNYGKLARPGGIDRETAEIENGELMMGVPAVPVLPFYDHIVHLRVHNKFRKSKQYLKLPPPVRMGIDFHCYQHEVALSMMMQRANAQAAGGQGTEQGPPGVGAGPESSGATQGPAALPNSRGGATGRSPIGQSNPGSE